MTTFDWDSVPAEAVTPLTSRKVIHTASMTVIQLAHKKGSIIQLHNHPHEQLTMMTSGSMRFEMDGESVVLGAGQVLSIPGDVPHCAEALEDATSTEVFVPARDDMR